jgi:hypothetical protein
MSALVTATGTAGCSAAVAVRASCGSFRGSSHAALRYKTASTHKFANLSALTFWTLWFIFAKDQILELFSALIAIILKNRHDNLAFLSAWKF